MTLQPRAGAWSPVWTHTLTLSSAGTLPHSYSCCRLNLQADLWPTYGLPTTYLADLWPTDYGEPLPYLLWTLAHNGGLHLYSTLLHMLPQDSTTVTL